MEGPSLKDKRYSGDNRLISPELISTGVWHLDVGSSHPGAGEGPKELGCSPIKVARELEFRTSWDSLVSIYSGRKKIWVDLTLVREEVGPTSNKFTSCPPGHRWVATLG